jgi:hypothetical protein
MVKLVIAVFALGLLFSTTVTFLDKKQAGASREFVWTKPGKNFWLGSDYKSYKLDSTQNLLISDDFSNWRKAKDTTWQDRFGRTICVYGNQLIWMANGTDWLDVPERTWQSIDGNWYRLDTKWQLWQSTVSSDRFDAAY